MIVHSLSGPSGTGKSTSAIQFAHEHGIEAIIDDGILVVNGEKKAGTSAKFEKNTITAVRRAIFHDEEHRNEVAEAIQEHDIQSLLIIGTSDKMTKQIANQLNLGGIDHFHYIEDVRSMREIQLAKFVRGTQGKHVMPIPYKQVEQNFFKRFIQRGFEIISKNRVKLGETTIVQPDFHQETVEISKNVYMQLLKRTVEQVELISKVDVLNFSMKQYYPIVDLVVYLKAPINYDVADKMRGVQKLICDEFNIHFEFEPIIKISIKGVL
ncbi:ATP-binding protein [Lysinibacillus endophyticus]|uniref:Uncharacterized protein n=1 Tax=Ureibacillus endophyticus TaxID=1978490 RepID=A0A494YTK2_9BACL|nr:hypothetical protein [Lysinibacillus endophyticus]MCP1144694.1 hypothetical protein [Lysinibacillus endophyticus]RKQ13442.1 hypothetical protein D8M03_16180 [Lysinibacillus endophyticus]